MGEITGLLTLWAIRDYAERKCLPLRSPADWDEARFGLELELELAEQRLDEMRRVNGDV